MADKDGLYVSMSPSGMV